MVIYLDLLLGLNLLVDYLLLAATARILQLPTRKRRLVFGAAVGALCSLVIFLPPLSAAVSLLLKLSGAALMVLAAFRFEGVWPYIRKTAVLFVISAVFAGVCMGLCQLFEPMGLFVQSGVVYFDVEPLLLVLFTVISYGVLCVFDRLTRKRVAQGFAYRLLVEEADRTIQLRAMLDSGHSLTDGFSGAPVVIVNADAVKALYPAAMLTAIGTADIKPMRYIPYSSVGGDGVLPAFRPTRVTLLADNRQLDITGVWVAPTSTIGRGDYDALIGPACVQGLL